MRKEVANEFFKRANDLKTLTGISINFNEIFKRINYYESYINKVDLKYALISREAGVGGSDLINRAEEQITTDFKNLYGDVYESFMVNNLKSEEDEEKKVESFLHFNNFMNDLLVTEYRDLFGEKSITKDGFSYGSLLEEEMETLNGHVLDSLGNIRTPFREFVLDVRAKNIHLNHFTEIKNEIYRSYDKLTTHNDNVENAKSKIVPLYVVLNEHYKHRNFFSQWFTKSGWQERNLIKDMQGMIANVLHEPELNGMQADTFKEEMYALAHSETALYTECVSITNEITKKTGEQLLIKEDLNAYKENEVDKNLSLISDELGENLFKFDAPEIEGSTRENIEIDNLEIDGLDFDNVEPISDNEAKDLFIDDELDLNI